MRVCVLLLALCISNSVFGQVSKGLQVDKLELDISCLGGSSKIEITDSCFSERKSMVGTDSILIYELDKHQIEELNTQLERIKGISERNRMRPTLLTCHCHGNYTITDGGIARKTGTFIYDKPPFVLRKLTRMINALGIK